MKSQLYLISPPKIDDVLKFQKTLDEIIAVGEIACFQLRLKEIENRDIAKIGKEIFPILQDAGIACIMNDNARLARDTHADGVHLGQSDGTIKEAREILGKDATIGVTCHNSTHLGLVAAEQGADYVAFGAFYETQTKISAPRAELEILKWWQDVMEIPCVAIGGITPENALPIINAGADFIAVSSAIWNNPQGPAQAVIKYNEVVKKASF
ncbi:MAG: thiamine-phosphate pyrophosphorylase [Hyphomonadaceae bacterium]|nr:MAG: thiamine-phosphate pyrophosphorylase [Hyphomonadaceae bacterium]KAF0183566.1 MAG: thiamine-phosphate pyrophosphorylase [Hyphomonadaceae bacterium]